MPVLHLYYLLLFLCPTKSEFLKLNNLNNPKNITIYALTKSPKVCVCGGGIDLPSFGCP